MNRKVFLFSALLVGTLAYSSVKSVHAEDNVLPTTQDVEKQVMMFSLSYNSPKNLKKEIKKQILTKRILTLILKLI